MADAGGRVGEPHAAAAAATPGSGGGAGGGAESSWKEWDDTATGVLLDLYTHRYLALHRGTLRSKEWQQVVDSLNAQCAAGHPVYTYNRCKNKIDSLKKTFKGIREKRKVGGGQAAAASWKWFSRMERIASRAAAAAAPNSSLDLTPAPIPGSSVKRSRMEHQSDDALHGFGEFDAVNEDASLGHLNGIHDDPLMIRSGYCPPPPVVHSSLRCMGAHHQQQQQQHHHRQHQQQQEFHSREAGKKRHKRSPSPSSEHHQQQQQMNGIAQMMIDALERMEQRRQALEEKRMEIFKELEMKRTETQWEIAKLIIQAFHQNQSPYTSSTHPRP